MRLVTTHPFARGAERPEDHLIVLFGATGDLARRKIIPGLFHLAAAELMPTNFRIVGTSPGHFAMTTDDFRDLARRAVDEFGETPAEGPAWDHFVSALSFVAADADDGSSLRDHLRDVGSTLGAHRRLFHLAVPPDAVIGLVEMMGSMGLNENSRVIFEKPFGVDLASASHLNDVIGHYFDETQVYRIDHFLGKESIDNILALRFANRLFEPLWNRDHIRFIQIDVPEAISIEGRGAFYEETGAFRDMVVTHLFQVLGYLAMEQPISFDAGPLRDEVNKVFQTMRPIDPSDVVRGQYRGYLDEPGVASDSTTETFVALRAFVDNTRWRGVPFYLRTGKSMAESRQVITIGFDEPVMRLFPYRDGDEGWRGNRLVVDFADPGSIHAHFLAKEPGPRMHLAPAEMSFYYAHSFQSAHGLEAYEHLVLEAMMGSRALFTRSDGIERLWAVAAPLLERPSPIEPYDVGSWGPASIERLVEPLTWCLPS